MPHIEWDESYSVHNAEMDEQHKKWLAIFNNINNVMMGSDTSSLSDITTDSLTEMYDYARNHFKAEEKYMSELNYPGLIEHRRMHRDFENQIYKYNREIQEGKILLNTSLLKIIKNWLMGHILTEDKKYSTFARRDISPKTSS